MTAAFPFWRGAIESAIGPVRDVGEAEVSLPVRVLRPALREVERLTRELAEANGDLAAVREERDEYADAMLAAVQTVPEVECPSGCGTTIRARLADRPAVVPAPLSSYVAADVRCRCDHRADGHDETGHCLRSACGCRTFRC